jgi:predicted peptidase
MGPGPYRRDRVAPSKSAFFRVFVLSRFRVLSLFLLIALCRIPSAAAVETGFINATVEADGKSIPYVVWVPRNYTEKQEWPVILFLHGAGERGEDGFTQVRQGIGEQLWEHPERFPCLVVMPQAPRSGGWGKPWTDLALKALDTVVKKYHGDRDRLYLTGLSMGGFGSFAIAAEHPKRFAAVMPICGGGRPAEMASALKEVNLWVVHGDADRAVPVQRSRDMVEAIKAAGGTKIQYTELAGVDHNSWDPTYAKPEVIAWLLAQKR